MPRVSGPCETQVHARTSPRRPRPWRPPRRRPRCGRRPCRRTRRRPRWSGPPPPPASCQSSTRHTLRLPMTRQQAMGQVSGVILPRSRLGVNAGPQAPRVMLAQTVAQGCTSVCMDCNIVGCDPRQFRQVPVRGPRQWPQHGAAATEELPRSTAARRSPEGGHAAARRQLLRRRRLRRGAAPLPLLRSRRQLRRHRLIRQEVCAQAAVARRPWRRR